MFDCIAHFLLLHVGREAAALDHEVTDHTMKNRAVVEAFLSVLQKVLHGVRRVIRLQFKHDHAHAGAHFHLRVLCVRIKRQGDCSQGGKN